MKTTILNPRFVAIVVLFSTAPGLAMAYIDPGNGAYMVQALFTVLGAALFYLKHPVRTIKAFGHWLVNRNRREPVSSESATPLRDGALTEE